LSATATAQRQGLIGEEHLLTELTPVFRHVSAVIGG
jgi:hypothetical protein